jgi:hypothetical protein
VIEVASTACDSTPSFKHEALKAHCGLCGLEEGMVVLAALEVAMMGSIKGWSVADPSDSIPQ